MVGSRIGPYKILRALGDDSLGALFEAVELGSNKPVAIRALNSEIAHRPETVARLHSEAKTLALLNHPHIARTFGFVRESDRLFLVTEFLAGETLQSVLEAKRGLEPPAALAYFHQLLSALSFAHDLGVIHGNLTPSKVLITDFGQVKVLDFARALLLREQETPLHDGADLYASPEQLRGEPADERSDLYSLGALFYHCLTGRRPFTGPEAIRAHHCGASTLLPPSILSAKCPPWLDDFILRAMAPAVSERFQTAAAMDRAMEMRVRSAAQVRTRPKASWPRVRAMARETRSAGSRMLQAREVAARQFGAVAAGFEQLRRATSRLGRDARAKLNAAHSSRRCVLRMNSGVTAARAALSQAHRRLLSQAGQVQQQCRQKVARAGILANTLGGSVRDTLTRRREGPSFGHRNRGARRHLGTLIGAWIRAKSAALLESGWQRYAAVAIVLASAMIELFVFGGANALLIFDRTEGRAIVQHGAAESFIEPAAETAVSPLRQAAAVEDNAPAPEQPTRASAGRKPPSRTRPEKENEYLDAWVAKRVVNYRVEAKAAGAESRVSDPPRKRNDSPPQLNVKWEN